MSNRGMSGTANSRKEERKLADTAHRLQYPTCGFEARNLLQLKLHMEQHRRMSALTCPICGFVAGSRAALVNHRNTHSIPKPIPTTFKCPYPDCPYSAGKDYELAGHLEAIHGENYDEMRRLMCTVPGCGYVAEDKEDFDNHLQEHMIKYGKYNQGGGRRRGRTRKARRASRNLRSSSRRS